MTHDPLADSFEKNRAHLRGVAYRMLGSVSEAEDAVQEAWIRMSRTDMGGVDNLTGWLTTVTARVCLDMLRSKKARREDVLDAATPETSTQEPRASDPESEAVMADSVGLALLVVLETLSPAERLALVMHDMFAVPFEEIADIVGRSPEATRQLASRARKRVQGAPAGTRQDLEQHRELVSTFLGALRAGDFPALLSVLHPDVVLRADAVAMGGKATEIHGALDAAKLAVNISKGARAARPALIDGAVGLVVAPTGRLIRVLRFTIEGDKISELNVVGLEEELARLSLALLPERPLPGTRQGDR